MNLLNRVSLCSRTVGVLALVGLLAYCHPASANDGGLAQGGSPRLLKGHPSVIMTSEVIHITVREAEITADCQFVFTNHGPACTARMGFPDEGTGMLDPDEEAPPNFMKTPPRTTFRSFRSYVDGTLVPTHLIRADKPGKYWHAKQVYFPAHSVRRVRDVYTQETGGGVATLDYNTAHPKGARADQLGYILHTGSSWHGPIGRTEIDVTFACKAITGNLRPVPLQQATTNNDALEVTGAMMTANTIVWKGPVIPKVKGKTLQFVRKNWRPTEHDDLELTYNYTIMPEENVATAWCADARRATPPLRPTEWRINGQQFGTGYATLLQKVDADEKPESPPGSLTFCLNGQENGWIAGTFTAKRSQDGSSKQKEGRIIAAAERGEVSALRSLVAQGISINVPEGHYSPLMAAAEHGHLKALTFLLTHGAELEATERAGYRTALLCARNAACVEALLKAAARPNAGNVDGETALFQWAENLTEEAAQIVRILIAHGADVNCGGEAGETVLLRAVSGGNGAIVQQLLAKGAEVRVTDDAGDTPLKIAKRKGRKDLIALLKRWGARE